eukprot:TRINITY_DN7795_c0_g1_i5.p1 TRINITY_DN7795_c0_g1~~TRINITY_DN7795_c0_g1_i5.p1  ORF type:complete len:338 (+),score=29.39 TRINITY_DN7795_c0_g1_i5:92-1105(+)
MYNPIFLLTITLALVSAKKYSIELKPFIAIRSCVPYAVQIKASAIKDLYSIDLDVDEDVYTAFSASVKDGELSLTSLGKFETVNPIKVTVNVPATVLTSVVTQGLGDLLMQGKFVIDELEIVSGGTKTIYAPDIEIKKALTVENGGVGDVSLVGDIAGQIDVSLQGIAKVYLKGVSGQVNLKGSGISTLGVDSSTDDVIISGTASALGKVQYTKGQCVVKGSSFMFSPCQKVTKLDIPETVTPLYWTCGIEVEGNSTCAANTVNTQTFVSDGGVATAVASSSSSATSGAVISSTSLTGLDGVTTASVQGQGASAVAISAAQCSVPSDELVLVDEISG